MTQLGTGTVTEPTVDPDLDHGDDEPRFSHYVRKEDILRSAVDGVAVTALCGKKWIPGRDPDKFPLCPKCKEMMDLLESMQ